MKFSEIVEHLSRRGYVTRERWQQDGHRMTLHFGMDNVGWLMWKVDEESHKQVWTLCLAEMWADDWIIMDKFFEFKNIETDDESC